MVVKLPPVEVVSTTVAPGVAVPETALVAAGCVVPVGGERIAIVGGATAVKVMGTEVEPPGPLAVTVSVFGPAVTLTGQAKVPLVAVVLHSVAPSGSVMVITLPTVAVPDTSGLVVVETLTGEVTLKLGGPTTVKFATAGLEIPPALVATAVTVLGPAGKVKAEVE